MIADLKPYPSYKDSGVPWLGNVPEHWHIPRLGALLRERGEKNSDGKIIEVLSVLRGRGVIPYSEKGNIGNKKSEDITRYKIVRQDDIVMNSMNVIIGSVGISRYTGCLSPVYYVMTRRSLKDNPKYLNAYFQTAPFQKSLVRIGNGILAHRMRIPMELLKCEPFPHPPPDEQSAIVQFLDHADRKIRRYIRAKQNLIKLLEEKKQVIINQAVTKGLDPSVRLKPSGVHWLGNIPEHWEVRRLKTLMARVTSGSRGWSDYVADEGPIFLRIGNLTRNSISLDFADTVRLNLPDEALRESERTRVSQRDILISITAYIGSVAVVPYNIGEAYISQHIACCKPKNDLNNIEWIGYVLLSEIGQTHGKMCMYGGTKQGLSLDDVKNYVILLPPRNEQDLIVDYINKTSDRIGRAIAREQKNNRLMGEFHTRLIADIVTGKLDVREAVAKLPDEDDDPEADDEVDEIISKAEEEGLDLGEETL